MPCEMCSPTSFLRQLYIFGSIAVCDVLESALSSVEGLSKNI